jgi:putative membrane protein
MPVWVFPCGRLKIKACHRGTPLKKLLWLLQWTLKAAIFFTLFAFALNNQDDATVHFFFGTQWRAPMVLVVLSAFVLGVVVGVLGMVPRWWRERRVAQQAQAQSSPAVPETPVAPTVAQPVQPATPPDAVHGL